MRVAAAIVLLTIACAQPAGVPKDVAEKTAALHSPDAVVRGTAAYSLKQMGARALPAAKDLIALLGDDTQLVREPEGARTSVSKEAGAALTAIGDKNIDAALFLDALKHQPWNGRDNVAEHLKYTGDPRSIPALVDALLEPGEDFPEIGMPDLSQSAMYERSVGPPAKPVDFARSTIAQALGTAAELVRERGGTVATPPRLIAALKSDNHSIRQYAIVALRGIGDASAVDPLLAIARDPSTEHGMRITATYSLCGIRDPRVVPALIAATSDPDPDIRGAAMRGLRDCRDRRAVPVLAAALKDPRNRRDAAEALSHIGGESAAPAILPLLNDPEPDTRQAIANALGTLRDERSIDPLIAALEREKLDYVRDAIGRALDDITHEQRGKDAAAWKRWRTRKSWEFWK